MRRCPGRRWGALIAAAVRLSSAEEVRTLAEATLAEEVREAAAANESIEEKIVELGQDVYRHRWVPSDAAADAIDGQTIRCLHREGKSNAFFYFKDDADEAAA